MAAIQIGRILPIFKGGWQGNIKYSKLDIVFYAGNSYVAKSDNTSIIPTNTAYWQIIAAKGTDGAAGAGADIKIITTNTNYVDL